MSIANTIGYSGNRTKNGETEYTDIFSSSLYPSGKSIQREDRRSNSVEWSGDYSFELPLNLWLVASPSATYTRSHNDSFFTSDGFEIANKVPETVMERRFKRHYSTLVRQAFIDPSAQRRSQQQLYGLSRYKSDTHNSTPRGFYGQASKVLSVSANSTSMPQWDCIRADTAPTAMWNFRPRWMRTFRQTTASTKRIHCD